MKTLTIRGLPDAVREGLKARARANRRSLNQEIVHQLEASLRDSTPVDVDREIEAVREIRARWLVQPMTPKEIAAATEEGRA